MNRKPKHSPKASLRHFLQGIPRSAKALFIASVALLAVALVLRLATGTFVNSFWPVMFSGLFAVLGISVCALQLARRRRLNPFTILLALTLAAFLGFRMYADDIRPDREYRVEDEPFNTLYDDLQTLLDGDGPFLWANTLHELFTEDADLIARSMGDQSWSLVWTDSTWQIKNIVGHWQTGSAQSLRPLVREAGDFGDHLVLLIDEKGAVVSAFWAEPDQVDGRYLSGSSSAYSPLTAYRQTQSETIAPTAEADTDDAPREPVGPTAQPEVTPAPTASVQPETTVLPPEAATETAQADELFDVYFPSFGPVIDEALYEYNLPRYLNTRLELSGYPAERQEEELNALLDYENTGGLSAATLNAALDALTGEEMTRLTDYAAWLQSMKTDASANRYRAQLLTSADGANHLYLLYQKPENGLEDHAFYPVFHSWHDRYYSAQFFQYASLCMIPTFIVFLAFWVLLDARRRGHRHPMLWAVLTLIGNIIAFALYLITRPAPSTMAAPKGSCPLCGAKLRSDFIACPGCGILLRAKCKTCGRALEKDWSFCPYCASAVQPPQPSEVIVNPPITVSGPEKKEDNE